MYKGMKEKISRKKFASFPKKLGTARNLSGFRGLKGMLSDLKKNLG